MWFRRPLPKRSIRSGLDPRPESLDQWRQGFPDPPPQSMGSIGSSRGLCSQWFGRCSDLRHSRARTSAGSTVSQRSRAAKRRPIRRFLVPRLDTAEAKLRNRVRLKTVSRKVANAQRRSRTEDRCPPVTLVPDLPSPSAFVNSE
jgi:hypothetical protein